MTLALFVGNSQVAAFNNNLSVEYIPTWRVQMWSDVNQNGVWDFGDNFVTMVPGQNTGTFNHPDTWGPEVGFASAWLEANPTGILFLGKIAKGETTIVQNGGLDWSPNSDGELFDAASFLAHCLRANLGVDSLDAVFIMDGETAAMNATLASQYAAAIPTFTAAVRAEWMNDPHGEIVWARIGDESSMPYAQTIREAVWQADQVDPDMDSFKTIGFERRDGDIHLSPIGELQLGHGFFDASL